MSMERLVLEYVLNAMWQLPLLVLGVALLLRVLRTESGARHGVWMGVLGLGVLLPVHGIRMVEGGRRPIARPVMPVVEATALPVLREGNRLERAVVHKQGTEVQTSPGPRWTAQAGALLLAAEGRLLLVHEVEIGGRTAAALLALYGAAVLWAVVRLGRGWWLARLLLRRSMPVTLRAEDAAVLHRESARLGLAPPVVRRAEGQGVGVAAVVGVRRPVLVIGEDFARSSEEERRAALCHELVHVRRDDGLLQAVAEVISVPVAWHPAISHGRWGLKAQLRETREMACDAEAAELMQSRVVYARCLLGIARRMGTPGMAAAAMMGMADGVLEERVLRLVEQRKESAMERMVRGAAGVAVCALTVAAVGAWHLQPVQAARVVPALRSAVLRARVVEQRGAARAADAVHARPTRGEVLRAQAELPQGKATVPMVSEAPEIQPLPPQGVAGATIAPPAAAAAAPSVQGTPAAPLAPLVDEGGLREQMAAVARQMQETMRQVNSPELQAQIARATQQAQTVDRAKIAEQMRALQRQMAAQQKMFAAQQRSFQPQQQWLNSEAFKRQMAEVAKLNTPEARATQEKVVRDALEQAQKSLAASQQQIEEELAATGRENADAQHEAERERKEAAQERAEAARDAAQEKAEAARDAAQEKAEAARDAAQDRAEAERDRREAQREASRERTEAAREKAQAARERAAAARERAREAAARREDGARAQDRTTEHP